MLKPHYNGHAPMGLRPLAIIQRWLAYGMNSWNCILSNSYGMVDRYLLLQMIPMPKVQWLFSTINSMGAILLDWVDTHKKTCTFSSHHHFLWNFEVIMGFILLLTVTRNILQCNHFCIPDCLPKRTVQVSDCSIYPASPEMLLYTTKKTLFL